jgi:hypothetical protein
VARSSGCGAEFPPCCNMSPNRPNLSIYFALCAVIAGCASTHAKRCTGLAKGPRPQSFALAALPSTTASATPEWGVVLGSVSDVETGSGVEHATVLIRTDTTSRAAAFVNTDSAGGFVLSPVRPGRYILEARGLGYPLTRKSIEVLANTIDSVAMTLHFNPYYLECQTVITR